MTMSIDIELNADDCTGEGHSRWVVELSILLLFLSSRHLPVDTGQIGRNEEVLRS